MYNDSQTIKNMHYRSSDVMKFLKYPNVLQPRATMPPGKAMDSDDDFEPSDDGSDGLISETDSDDDFQEDLVHRAVLGRPRSAIYDAKAYISRATGMAGRSGLDAARLEATSDNWKAADGSKRQRRSPAAFAKSRILLRRGLGRSARSLLAPTSWM